MREAMTPGDRADRICSRMQGRLPSVDHRLLRKRIIEEIEAAVAETKAEQRREWEEKLRLVHGVEW